MNPETTVAIFNGLCIAGGALVGFGSIVLLEVKKRNQKVTLEPVGPNEWLEQLPNDVKIARESVAKRLQRLKLK
ncbi:MAG: hypothetical protein AAB876_01455 [Patescibacteria group bacterium]